MSDFHSDLAGSSPATRFMINEQELEIIKNDLHNIRINIVNTLRGLRQIEEYLESKLPKKEGDKSDV